MEHETITIELKKETAIMLIWLASGVFLVVVAFFLPGNSPDLWEPLAASGVMGIAYIATLVIYCTRPPVSARRRWTTIGITILTLLAAGMGWVGQKEQSQWERETILSIREMIGRGVLFHYVTVIFKEPYDAFHSQKGPVKQSLGQMFRSRYPGVVAGQNMHKPEWKADSSQIILGEVSEHGIGLVVVDPISRGRDPMFRNIGGRTGKLQERYTLTEGGLIHESEN